MNHSKACQPGLSILAVFFLWTLPAFSFEDKLDIVIKGGRIVDGTGSPWYAADLAIGKNPHLTMFPRDQSLNSSVG